MRVSERYIYSYDSNSYLNIARFQEFAQAEEFWNSPELFIKKNLRGHL